MHTTMLPDPTKDCSTEQLACLFDLLMHPQPIWSQEDMADLMKAQWASPVTLNWDDDEGVSAGSADELPSIGEVLESPSPQVEQLIAIKNFARQCLAHPDEPLPKPICRVLYICSIAVARLCCHQSISTLNQQEIADRIKVTLREPWLIPSVRSILDHALTCLGERTIDRRGDTTT